VINCRPASTYPIYRSAPSNIWPSDPTSRPSSSVAWPIPNRPPKRRWRPN